MKKGITLFFALMLGLVSFATHAKGNPAPLGFEIGVSKASQIKDKYNAASDIGENKYSLGRMLVVNGDDLNVKDVQKATFIFDTSDVLQGVILTMNKDPSGVFKFLSSKYQVVSNNIDSFMNYGYAKFKSGGKARVRS